MITTIDIFNNYSNYFLLFIFMLNKRTQIQKNNRNRFHFELNSPCSE